jgi:hypothetical protein
MQRRGLYMVISKVIRPKKKTLKSVIDTGTKDVKIPTRTKIINVLKEHDNGLPIMELMFIAGVRSGGNIHQCLKFMVKAKEVIKETCPHCNNTELYKLVL